MTRLGIAILAALLVAAQADAQCRTIYSSSYGRVYAPSYSYPAYHAPVHYEAPVKVYKEAVYQAIIPVFQIEVRQYKTYGAVYQPPVPGEPAGGPAAPTTPPGGSASELRQILDAIRSIDVGMKGLDTRIKALEERAGKAKPADPFNPGKEDLKKEGARLDGPAPKLPDVHTVAKAKCAVCHDAKLGDDASASFIMTKDDRMVPLTDRQTSQTLVKLAKAKMCSGAAEKGIAPTTPEEYTAFVLWLEKAKRKEEREG